PSCARSSASARSCTSRKVKLTAGVAYRATSSRYAASEPERASRASSASLRCTATDYTAPSDAEFQIPNPKSHIPNPNLPGVQPGGWDLELGIWGLGFGAWDLGCGIWILGFLWLE